MRKRLVIESCVSISADHVHVHARVFSRELLSRKEILGCPSTGREMICITAMTLSSHRNKTELPYAKGAHPAFRTQEALAQHCQEMGINQSASDHAKVCAVFRPIILGMIQQWPEMKALL